MATKNVNPKCEIDVDLPQHVKMSADGDYFILQNKNEYPSFQFVQTFDDYMLAYAWVKEKRKGNTPKQVIQAHSKSFEDNMTWTELHNAYSRLHTSLISDFGGKR